jgi:hypothetical protein
MGSHQIAVAHLIDFLTDVDYLSAMRDRFQIIGDGTSDDSTPLGT